LAETVYVSDRFEIGVHESAEIDSVILAVIPSGTALTVIARDGEFVQVSTTDGTRGWVDARYVVSEKPSAALFTEHDEKLQEAVRSLGASRAEVEVLRQRVSELQRDAATAADASPGSPGITKTVSIEAREDSAKLAEAKRELESLAQENRELKIRVVELDAARAALEESVAEAEAVDKENSGGSMWRGPVSEQAQSWTPWQWLLFGSILLLAFAAGGYAVDWESRRRHGGFRV
jgi:SH3 domain protein